MRLSSAPPPDATRSIPGPSLGWGFRFRVILGLYWDNGKENENYYLGFRNLGFRAAGLRFTVAKISRICSIVVGLGFEV